MKEIHDRALAKLRLMAKNQRFHDWLMAEAERSAWRDLILYYPRVGYEVWPATIGTYGAQN